MSSASAFEGLEDYLKAEWTATPIVFENEDWPLADDPAAFVFIEIFGDFFGQASIGAPGENIWREEGQIRAHVMVVRNTGTRVARQCAQQLAAFFQEVEVADGIHFSEMSIGAGEPGAADGNYYRMTLMVDWYRDSI